MNYAEPKLNTYVFAISSVSQPYSSFLPFSKMRRPESEPKKKRSSAAAVMTMATASGTGHGDLAADALGFAMALSSAICCRSMSLTRISAVSIARQKALRTRTLSDASALSKLRLSGLPWVQLGVWS